MIVNDLYLCDHFSYIQECEIILYGTGYWGEQAYQVLKKSGARILAVCNTAERERQFHQYPVLSLCQVKERYDRSGVLILLSSLKYYPEMLENCEMEKFSYAKACTLYALYQSLFLHAEDAAVPEQLRMELAHNLEASGKRVEYFTKFYAYETMLQAAEADGVFIYQPGKAGSRSIWKSVGSSSVHFHSLVIPFGCPEFSREHLNYYLEKIRSRKIKIITGVREPIARDLAAMFQNSELDLWPFTSANSNVFWWYGDFLGEEKGRFTSAEIEKRSPRWKGTLQESFYHLSQSIVKYGLDEFSWFSYEIQRVFGIDVFQEPFDRERGYSVIQKGNVEIFLYQLEKLGSLEQELGAFLEKPGFRLESMNRSRDKIYDAAYQELKKTVKLPETYFVYYYGNNPFYRHFYTEEDIGKCKRVWEVHVDESK